MTRPLLPRPDEILTPGLEKLVALRPGARPHLARGRYGHPFAGWRAQVALLLRRLASEAEASRLPLARGASLVDLCASEFDTVLPSEPRAAVGEVILRRAGGPAGVIRRGTRWRRAADPDSPLVPKGEALYESVEDHVVPQDARETVVKIRATRPGTFANIVLGAGPLGAAVNGNDVQPVDRLFDSGLRPFAAMAAGGSDGTGEELLRRAARAYAVGRYGPTLGALVAAALRAGAVHVAAFEQPARAVSAVLVADASWASSGAWVAQIEERIRDEVAGFGCRVRVIPTTNVFVRAECTVTLRRASDLVDTSAITRALGQALRRTFDERPDWWTWRLSALRGIASRAHRAILGCSSVALRDAVTNAELGEPSFQPKAGPTGEGPFHTFLSDNAVQVTYCVPT